MKNKRWQTALPWLAGISALFYVFSRFLPCTPPDQYPAVDDIDNAWTQALHIAFFRNFQFGRDFVFTYGPWGFISRGYHPSTHWVSMVVWIGLSVIFWRAAGRVARHFSDNQAISWLWLIAFTAFSSIPVGDDFSARLVAWAVLLLFLHFFVEEGSFTSIQIALVVSLGLLSLAKFTGLIAAAAVVAVIATDDLRRCRFPWIVVVLGASILCFWKAAGQHWSSLAPYLLNSLRITGGYTEAMMRKGATETRDVICFLVLAASVTGLTGFVARGRPRFQGGLVLAGLGAILFLIFKEGFVRCDRHEVGATTGLLLIALASLAVTWREKRSWLRYAGVTLLSACALFASAVYSHWFSEQGLVRQLAGTFSLRSLTAPVQSAFTGSLYQHFEEDALTIRTRWPLPAVSGEVDLYTGNLTAVFAQNFRYDPRPVIQSFSAYTPELAELNASFLRTPRAPDYLFFQVKTIDGRYPSLDDGRSWPELLTRYDIRGASDGRATFLVLAHSASPREYHLELLTNMVAQFGESVPVPAVGDGPVWVEMDIKESFWGDLASTLYKPPGLQLNVSLRDYGEHRFRMIPGMARSGFLVSPFIGDNLSFGWLASTESQRALAGLEVTSLSVLADTAFGSSVCYKPPVQIRFYRLIYPRQNLNKAITEKKNELNGVSQV